MGDVQKLFRFGPFELNLATEELRKNGIPIKLSPQPIRILALLAGRSGQIVTREEIRQQVWGEETYVDFEHGMNQCIKQIRTVLSDNPEKPIYIETLPRKGYRFLVPVTSKTITATLAVVESTSGIQVRPVLPTPTPAPTAPLGTPAPLSAMPLASLSAPVATPTAAAPALAPEARAADVGSSGAAVASAPESPAVPVPVPTLAKRSRVAVASAVLMLLVIVAFVYWHSRTASALAEKETFVMADFQNTTGDAVFNDALQQALAIQLEQSQFLTQISGRKLAETLQLMNRPADQHITRSVAEEICQRTGNKLVLDGSIAPIGDHFLLAVKATNCQSGELIASAEGEAENRNQVVKILGQVGNELRKKLGESLPSIEKFNAPLELATTSSLEALQAYTQGFRMRAQGDAALPYFKRALELDPNFARAYVALGAVYINLGDKKLSAENYGKAFQLRDRVTQRERLQIESAYYGFVTGQLDEAIQSYQQWIRTYPDDIIPRTNLGVIYAEVGRYDKAAGMMEETAKLTGHPDYNLVIVYSCLNNLPKAKALVEQAQQEGDSTFLRQLRYAVAFMERDTATMQKLLTESMGRPETEDYLLGAQSDTEAFFGHVALAREFSARAIQLARRSEVQDIAATWKAGEALREAEVGNFAAAQQAGEQALAMGGGSDVEVLAGLAMARAGDVTRAQSIADKLERDYPHDTLIQNYWLPSIRAAMELQKPNPGAAVELLKSTLPYELGSTSTAGGVAAVGTMYPIFLRGEAYLKSGDGQQAAAEFQKIIDHPGIVGNFILAPLAQLQLARSQAMTGDEKAARKSYEVFLGTWKSADQDIALLQQAKAEYAKLRPEP